MVDATGTEQFLEVSTIEKSLKMIKNVHDIDHPGINATVRKIRQNYYWIRLSEEVNNM